MGATQEGWFSVREAKEDDLEALGLICFNAFKQFNESVGNPLESDFPSIEIATMVIRSMLTGPRKGFGAVAIDRLTGWPIGCAFLHRDSEVYSIGPVTVDPDNSSKGVGKAMMNVLIKQAKEEGATSIRLTQVASNTKSFCLYLALGFVPQYCFSVFRGTISLQQAADAASALGFEHHADANVRLLEDADVGECAALLKKAMGYDRTNAIRRSLGPSAWVLRSKSGEILAYTTGFQFFHHTAAQSEEHFITLFLGVVSKVDNESFLTISTHLHPRLGQWAMAAKLPLQRHKWYMVMGEYKAPHDSFVYLPSGFH